MFNTTLRLKLCIIKLAMHSHCYSLAYLCFYGMGGSLSERTSMLMCTKNVKSYEKQPPLSGL
nr:ORF52 [Bracoviriform inaniti]